MAGNLLAKAICCPACVDEYRPLADNRTVGGLDCWYPAVTAKVCDFAVTEGKQWHSREAL
jgi:hypothetical protein